MNECKLYQNMNTLNKSSYWLFHQSECVVCRVHVTRTRLHWITNPNVDCFLSQVRANMCENRKKNIQYLYLLLQTHVHLQYEREIHCIVKKNRKEKKRCEKQVQLRCAKGKQQGMRSKSNNTTTTKNEKNLNTKEFNLIHCIHVQISYVYKIVRYTK